MDSKTIFPIKVPIIGCKCPPISKRQFVSSIVGCGERYGCSFDSWGCPLCPQVRYRYRAWAEQHIRHNHSENHNKLGQ